MKKCKDYFGFKPFIVAIDIADPQRLRNAVHFSGIENFMYIPANPAQIEQFLINFKDMDEFDVYTRYNHFIGQIDMTSLEKK